jgi:unspecific monooxygenase
MRMNEGPQTHDEPKARLAPLLAGLAARALVAPAASVAPQQVNDALFEAPLALLGGLLGVSPEESPAIARQVRQLVAGWAAGADTVTLQHADAAARSLLERFDGDANRIGLFTQTCDATAGLLGIALTVWQRNAAAALDADGLAAIAQHDPPVQNTRRFVAEPVTLCGQALRPGNTVLVLLASANHDVAAQHGWGRGRHACPGERLSQAIAARVLQHWLAEDAPGWRRATARWRYRPSPNARIPEFIALQHHLDHRVRSERAVETVELLAAGGRDGDREAQVVAAAAGAHLQRRGVERRVVLQRQLDDGLREAVDVGAHHLDREGARVLDQRFVDAAHMLCCCFARW